MEPRLFMYDATSGPGEAVVLIPGGLTGWNSWAPYVEALSKDRTVVRVQPTQNELGGMNGSVGDPTYTAELELAGLVLALDELSLDRVHVAGWSNGGKIALHLALADLERVRSLTVIEPAAPWVLKSAGTLTTDLDSFMEQTHRFAGRQVTDDDLATFFVSAEIVPEQTDRAAMEELPVWAAGRPLRNALSWGFPATWGDHHVDELASVRCPTLVVRGTETAPWLAATAALVAERIPRAEILELPGGHASHLQNADVFMAAFRNHLDTAQA